MVAVVVATVARYLLLWLWSVMVLFHYNAMECLAVLVAQRSENGTIVIVVVFSVNRVEWKKYKVRRRGRKCLLQVDIVGSPVNALLIIGSPNFHK